MARVTEFRCDPDLTEILVKQSLPTAQWMRKRGVRFTAAWGRQAFRIGGKFKFWGGLTLEAVGGGPGLIESETQLAKKAGIEIWYGARALSLIADDDGVHGVVVRKNNKTMEVKGDAVVLAAGGFQANTEWRTRYMVPSTPVVVTLPSTVPSELTRMVPLPEPGTVTGGTSSAPDSLTLTAPLPGRKLGA